MYFASGASRNEAGGASKLEEAIISALGKNTEKWERIDFEKRMHELKLDTFIPEEVSNSQILLVIMLLCASLFRRPAGRR